MSAELRAHTADIAVEATGKTLSGTFEAAADGLAAAMYDGAPKAGDRLELTRTAESREALLFDYYQRDVRGVLSIENEATIREIDGDWTVEASARGVPLSSIAAREVKAVTAVTARKPTGFSCWSLTYTSWSMKLTHRRLLSTYSSCVCCWRSGSRRLFSAEIARSSPTIVSASSSASSGETASVRS